MGGEASERKVAQGTVTRPDRDFEQSQKLETLGMLACGVAHDFNNLLVAILGNAGLVLQDLDAESRARPQVEEIKRAAIRAAELTEQVLVYAGRGREPVQVMDLNLAIGEMAGLLRVSIPQTTELSLELSADPAPVEADPSQIRQVLMNLILNAAQSLPDQRGSVRIATSCEADQVLLEVRDTGSGMSASTQAKIFEAFFTTRSKGSGLGLAAVKRIVERHGGSIKVRSKVGEGSCFSIQLTQSSKALSAANCDKSVAREYHGHGQVLLIEAEESIRRLVSTCLAGYGFEVETMSNPTQLSRACKNLHGDLRLVILDLGRNAKASKDALSTIRQLQPDLPVMISTGLGRGEAQEIDDMIFNGYLAKPYSPEQLLAAVKKTLRED